MFFFRLTSGPIKSILSETISEVQVDLWTSGEKIFSPKLSFRNLFLSGFLCLSFRQINFLIKIFFFQVFFLQVLSFCHKNFLIKIFFFQVFVRFCLFVTKTISSKSFSFRFFQVLSFLHKNFLIQIFSFRFFRFVFSSQKLSDQNLLFFQVFFQVDLW